MKSSIYILVLGSLASAGAQAQKTERAATARSLDPNRVICEKIEELGSRLSYTKVCLTAAQWAEKRQAERDDAQRAQSQSGCGHFSHC